MSDESSGASTPTPTPGQELAVLADRFWERLLAAWPTSATYLGDHRFDDRVEDRRPGALDAVRAEFEAVAAAAEAIDPAALGPADRITRRMLADVAAGDAERIATGLHEWTVDHMSGPQTRFLDLSDFQPVETVEQGRAMVARWRAVGPLLDQEIADLRRSLGEGRVAARPAVERVLAILDAMLAEPPDTWRMAAPATAAHDDWPHHDLERFRRDLIAAVRDVVVPAFTRYRDVLRGELLAAARPPERPGLCFVPGGEDTYRALIRYHTTLPLEPTELHAMGLAEIDRIDEAFVTLGRRVLGTSDLASTLAALRGDASLRFGDAQEVFDTAVRSLERAQTAVPAWFGRLPKAPCVVVPIPDETAPQQTIAYYWAPAIDGSRPGRYYINLYDPTGRPRYEAEALAFHEAVPGHHLQLAIAQELDGLPAFQKNLGSTAYIEGWGLYAERLSEEMGLYGGDIDRFGILSFDAWRACRLVVDTGMHAMGWSRDRAIAYLRDHTALDEFNIVNEIDRYIVEPAQALAYKVGQLELLRLREAARERLGDRFDIRAYHDVVLGSGAVSMTTLAEMVDAWIEATAAG